MAENFRISVHRNSESLHIKLAGDFDGSSAQALLDALRSNGRKASRVFIHTGSLQEIHPLGRDVFCSNMDQLKDQVVPMVFTGENAALLAPEKNPWSSKVSYVR
jgi:anti-anti-sigma regulatory factor